MKPTSSALTVAVIASLSGLANAAPDITVVTSLAFQDKALSFDQKYSGNASNRAEFSVHIPMVSAGATLAIGKFFTSLKLETNLAETSTTTNETDRSQTLESNLITHPGGTLDVKREDISLTFGVNVWKSLNVFVGYLDGKTELKPDPFCANPFASTSPEFSVGAPETIPCSRSNRAFQQFFIGDNPGQTTPPFYYVAGQQAYEQEYSENGFYLGSSYGFNIADAGTLSVSFAYAIMDGRYKDNANDSSQQPDPDDPTGPLGAFNGSFTPFDYEGDSKGTSIALTWTSALGDNTAYTIDLRRQAYSMDGKDQTGNLPGVFLDTDEEMLGLTAGVQVYF